MRPIDADKIVFDYSGLVYIPAHDGAAIAKYFVDQIKAMPTITPPPNDPLTLDELREMDGEPAYLPSGECWVIVTFNGFAPVFNWPDGSSCSAADWCNNVGPAYRRKPENTQA